MFCFFLLLSLLVLYLRFQHIWVPPNVTLLLKSYLTGVCMPLTLHKWAGGLPVWLLQSLPGSSYSDIIPGYYELHCTKAFLPPHACKVIRKPSLPILESANCLAVWIFSPPPTEELEMGLKSSCIWSFLAVVYWQLLLENQNGRWHFSAFLWSLDVQFLDSEVSITSSYSHSYQIVLHENSFTCKMEVA